jgi:hypothetical protein
LRTGVIDDPVVKDLFYFLFKKILVAHRRVDDPVVKDLFYFLFKKILVAHRRD